jgi:hypothetical protein
VVSFFNHFIILDTASGEPDQCGSGPDTLDSQGLDDGSIIAGLDPNEVRFCCQALLEQTGVEATEVSEVILGQVLAAGQGQNPARQVPVMDARVGLQNML